MRDEVLRYAQGVLCHGHCHGPMFHFHVSLRGGAYQKLASAQHSSELFNFKAPW